MLLMTLVPDFPSSSAIRLAFVVFEWNSWVVNNTDIPTGRAVSNLIIRWHHRALPYSVPVERHSISSLTEQLAWLQTQSLSQKLNVSGNGSTNPRLWLLKARTWHFKSVLSKCISDFCQTSRYTNKDIWSDYERIICWKPLSTKPNLSKLNLNPLSVWCKSPVTTFTYMWVQTSSILQYTRETKT